MGRSIKKYTNGYLSLPLVTLIGVRVNPLGRSKVSTSYFCLNPLVFHRFCKRLMF